MVSRVKFAIMVCSVCDNRTDRLGFELSTIQQVHQYVGIEAMKYRTPKALGSRKKATASNLCSLLQRLVPSRESIIKALAVSIVEKAINLRDQMTEEHEIYQCNLPYCGDPFNEGHHQLGSPSGDSGGSIHLCTFPGLTRFTVFNHPIQERFVATVVKARVIRDSEWRVWGGVMGISQR